MRIAILHGNDGTDVRIGKLCRSLSAMGHEVHFIGWDRRPDMPKQFDLGSATPHITVYPTRFGRANLRGQWHYFKHALGVVRRLRPGAVQCVNEDMGLLMLPFRGWLYRYLICDVFDSLVDRHSHRPRPIVWMLRTVSELVRGGSDRLIATDQARWERFGRFRNKCIVVENMPEDPGDELWRTVPTGPAKVYVAGTLTVGRGLPQILQAAEQVGDVQIISAGWLYDDYANNTFAKHAQVRFDGIVTLQGSLALAAECDAVLAFYSPSSTNNLYASPNKIYDAVSVGRPVIINSEILVSRWVREHQAGWTCGFDDVEALTAVLSVLKASRATLAANAQRLRGLYLDGCTWQAMAERLGRLYRELSRTGGANPSSLPCRE